LILRIYVLASSITLKLIHQFALPATILAKLVILLLNAKLVKLLILEFIILQQSYVAVKEDILISEFNFVQFALIVALHV